tara:strand:- start:1003 stop:1332 length:330 start_codon:yes stop_codon:yes gene_type:complete
MKNENKNITLTLTVEELDLIRHATWALESKLETDIEEFNSKEDDDYQKTDNYYIQKNVINKDMYFDSIAMRSKVIKANSDSYTYDERKAFEEEHGLKAGDLCSRYANNS